MGNTKINEWYFGVGNEVLGGPFETRERATIEASQYFENICIWGVEKSVAAGETINYNLRSLSPEEKIKKGDVFLTSSVYIPDAYAHLARPVPKKWYGELVSDARREELAHGGILGSSMQVWRDKRRDSLKDFPPEGFFVDKYDELLNNQKLQKGDRFFFTFDSNPEEVMGHETYVVQPEDWGKLVGILKGRYPGATRFQAWRPVLEKKAVLTQSIGNKSTKERDQDVMPCSQPKDPEGVELKGDVLTDYGDVIIKKGDLVQLDGGEWQAISAAWADKPLKSFVESYGSDLGKLRVIRPQRLFNPSEKQVVGYRLIPDDAVLQYGDRFMTVKHYIRDFVWDPKEGYDVIAPWIGKTVREFKRSFGPSVRFQAWRPETAPNPPKETPSLGHEVSAKIDEHGYMELSGDVVIKEGDLVAGYPKSPNTKHTIFKEHVGKTVAEFLEWRRNNSKNYSVADIKVLRPKQSVEEDLKGWRAVNRMENLVPGDRYIWSFREITNPDYLSHMFVVKSGSDEDGLTPKQLEEKLADATVQSRVHVKAFRKTIVWEVLDQDSVIQKGDVYEASGLPIEKDRKPTSTAREVPQMAIGNTVGQAREMMEQMTNGSLNFLKVWRRK